MVGQAELLSAALSLLALLIYLQLTGGAPVPGPGGAPWVSLAAAVLLAWLAALGKEIGITVLGSMAVYDILLARPARGQLIRLPVLAGAAVAYVKLRSWVAGDHLVRIYRKVGETLLTELGPTPLRHLLQASLPMLPGLLLAM